MLIIGNFGLSYTQSKAQMGLWSEKRAIFFGPFHTQDRLGTKHRESTQHRDAFSQEHHGRSSPYGQ